jgi:hypothetical protein
MALFVWMIIIAVNVTLHNNIFHSNSYIILIRVMCLWPGLVVDTRYVITYFIFSILGNFIVMNICCILPTYSLTRIV